MCKIAENDNNDQTAVIFDLDGVIIDSLEVQRLAFETVYRRFRKHDEPPFTEFMKHSGDSLHNIFSRMNLPLEMIETYRAISSENIYRIKLHNGIKELLPGLKNTNNYCGLCTGKERKRTIDIMRKFDLLGFFDIIVCSDDIRFPKPDPESIYVISGHLNVELENMIIVGDAVNDILCARNAGIKSIAFTWGQAEEKALSEMSPDFIVNHPHELHMCIKNFLQNRNAREKRKNNSLRNK